RGGGRVEGEAETVAAAVGEDCVDVGDHVIQLRGRKSHAGPLFQRADLRGRDAHEGVVAGRGAVGVEPENDPGDMGIVGRWAAELVIRLSRTERTAGQVLQLATATVV